MSYDKKKSPFKIKSNFKYLPDPALSLLTHNSPITISRVLNDMKREIKSKNDDIVKRVVLLVVTLAIRVFLSQRSKKSNPLMDITEREMHGDSIFLSYAHQSYSFFGFLFPFMSADFVIYRMKMLSALASCVSS